MRLVVKRGGVWKFKWLPGYYVKYNIDRLKKRQLLDSCIQEKNLYLLHTPAKYLYHINGRPHKFTSQNYAIIIKEVEDDEEEYDKPIDEEQVKQMVHAVEETGHISTFKNNYLRLKNRRISFIDTDGTFNKERSIVGIARLLDGGDLPTHFTPEALYYLIDHLGYRIAHASASQKKEAYKAIDYFLGKQKSSVRKRIYALLEQRIEEHANKKSMLPFRTTDILGTPASQELSSYDTIEPFIPANESVADDISTTEPFSYDSRVPTDLRVSEIVDTTPSEESLSDNTITPSIAKDESADEAIGNTSSQEPPYNDTITPPAPTNDYGNDLNQNSDSQQKYEFSAQKSLIRFFRFLNEII